MTTTFLISGNPLQSLLEDCNGNGIVDSHGDIDSGVFDDADADGTPDECDPRVPQEYLVPSDFGDDWICNFLSYKMGTHDCRIPGVDMSR